MQDTTVYAWLIIFTVLILPMHFYNYLYISSEDKFAAYNLKLYKYIPVIRISTIKNHPMKMDINGNESGISAKYFNHRVLEIAKRLSILKIVQLGDYGSQKTTSLSVALLQHTITETVYGMMHYADNNIKLKNYSIINEESSSVHYCLKVVNSMNLLSLISIMVLMARGKLNVFQK